MPTGGEDRADHLGEVVGDVATNMLHKGVHLCADLPAVIPLARQVILVLRQPWDQLVRFSTYMAPPAGVIITGVDCGHRLAADLACLAFCFVHLSGWPGQLVWLPGLASWSAWLTKCNGEIGQVICFVALAVLHKPSGEKNERNYSTKRYSLCHFMTGPSVCSCVC